MRGFYSTKSILITKQHEHEEYFKTSNEADDLHAESIIDND